MSMQYSHYDQDVSILTVLPVQLLRSSNAPSFWDIFIPFTMVRLVAHEHCAPSRSNRLSFSVVRALLPDVLLCLSAASLPIV